MRNIVSCRPESYRKYRDEAYEHLAKIGVHHVELVMPKIEDVDSVLKELERHGLSIASLHAPCNIQNKNVSDEFKLPVEVAQRVGAKKILASVQADDLEVRTAYQRLRDIEAIAAEANLIVILETHPDLATNGGVSRQTMEGVDHPNVRINFDTANIHYYNECADTVEEMKKILEYIEGVHLKDTNGEFETWYFPTLGEGIVDFSKVRELLNNRGFFGPFTIEIEGIKGENLTLKQTLKRMEKSIDHLRKCGF
jgi:sugar phosphate isomerase/epimerase